MKKLICILAMSLITHSAFAEEELSPAEKEMVEIAKQKIKDLRRSKRPTSSRLRDRMQSEAESVRVEETKPKK